MDYPYMPKEIREQGQEAIERKLEKEERFRAVLGAIYSGVLFMTMIMGIVFLLYMCLSSLPRWQYEYSSNGQTGIAESCKVSNGAFVCVLSDGTKIQADSFKAIAKENE